MVYVYELLFNFIVNLEIINVIDNIWVIYFICVFFILFIYLDKSFVLLEGKKGILLDYLRNKFNINFFIYDIKWFGVFYVL